MICKVKPAPIVTPVTPTPKAKLGKSEMVDQLAQQTGLSRKQAAEGFDAMAEVMLDTLKAGQSVGLPSLGTLRIKETTA